MKKQLFLGAILATVLGVAGQAAFLEGSITLFSVGASINGPDLAGSTQFTPTGFITPGLIAGAGVGDYAAIPLLTSITGGTIDTTNPTAFTLSVPGYGVFGDAAGFIVLQTQDFFQMFFEGTFTPEAGPLAGFDPSPAVVRVSLNKSGLGVAYGATLESITAVTPEEIPEPATCALFGAGIFSVAVLSRRRT
ncbi:MAG: PEP-CTERM sorting domain-containing protein [Bryobacteraceae bacterium]|nr:PEP-CTERM sorting domain-containing protein [Bryobacteraceae bacterium]